MRKPFRFFVELVQQPILVPVWVGVLMIVNIASVAFWAEPLAKVIFVIFMLSAMLMMGLYSRFGFEKILGVGHAPWIPLLVYVLIAAPAATGGFRTYLVVWAVSTVISLALDAVDVWNYFAGGRDGKRED